MKRSRSQWPNDLRHGSAAARLLSLWIRKFSRGHKCLFFVSVVCCQVEESYRMWRVFVCCLETSWMRRPWTNGGCRSKNKQKTYKKKSLSKRNYQSWNWYNISSKLPSVVWTRCKSGTYFMNKGAWISCVPRHLACSIELAPFCRKGKWWMYAFNAVYIFVQRQLCPKTVFKVRM